MRTIKKGAEPPLLAVYKKSTGAAFDYLPTDVKDEIKERLIKEQRGLCCYCQSRIRATWDGMKVEHWKSQSPDKYPEHQLDYSNLLGACSGGQKYGESSPKEKHHCDTLKGDSDLCFPLCDMARPIEKKIKYSSLGTVCINRPRVCLPEK